MYSSEEVGARLSEQARLLKEEIRRLERNQEREEGVANMEYLKNIVLKVLYMCVYIYILIYTHSDRFEKQSSDRFENRVVIDLKIV